MLLTGILAGGAVTFGVYKYNAAQANTKKEIDKIREKMVAQKVITPQELERLKRYESTYGNTFNNVLLDKLSPNSIIRSNRKSHKLFQKNRKKLKELEAKKSPYVNEDKMFLREKDAEDGFTEIEKVKPVDTYKVGKYVVSYDYLKETPNYMVSYTNSIFGHMHKGLKAEMDKLRKDNAAKASNEEEIKEFDGFEVIPAEEKLEEKDNKRTIKEGTLEYKLLVESQQDIEASRKVKNKAIAGIGKYITKRFGNLSQSGRAMNAHNTLKKRIKRNIAAYQEDSLKAYRELQSSLIDEKELLDAKSEDVVSKYDDIFFTDTKVVKNYKTDNENAGVSLVESKLAFDPMQVNLEYKGKMKVIDHDNKRTMANYQTLANIYKQLVASTYMMRTGKGTNYATIISAIKQYGDLMDGARFEDKLPMCHGFFRTGSMRRAMSAGIVEGTDKVADLKLTDIRASICHLSRLKRKWHFLMSMRGLMIKNSAQP